MAVRLVRNFPARDMMIEQVQPVIAEIQREPVSTVGTPNTPRAMASLRVRVEPRLEGLAHRRRLHFSGSSPASSPQRASWSRSVMSASSAQ